MVFSALFLTSTVKAQENGLRVGAGMGVGILVAGDKHITGGFSLSLNFFVGISV